MVAIWTQVAHFGFGRNRSGDEGKRYERFFWRVSLDPDLFPLILQAA